MDIKQMKRTVISSKDAWARVESHRRSLRLTKISQRWQTEFVMEEA